MFRDPLTATFEHATGSIAIEVPNVPYQRNWRTNIIGNLFTEKVVANVLIVPIYEDDHNLDETGKPIQ